MKKVYKPKRSAVLMYGTFTKAIIGLHPSSRWTLDVERNGYVMLSNHSTTIEVSNEYLKKYFEVVS